MILNKGMICSGFKKIILAASRVKELKQRALRERETSGEEINIT